ncbi:MAG: DUF3270 domain-containing protein [Streptococcaceae bacterium]|nr:DUF3270 domain-containing protein [Streptococcaceae bacterium]MCL2681312.1 DUF3270 domain-containing protein [Streptococcaceae bacterium]
MELRDLEDFNEKQEYIDYNSISAQDTQNNLKTQKEFNKRLKELTFFVNIGVFSILLVIITTFLLSSFSAFVAIPLSILLSFIIFISCKQGIKFVLQRLIKKK